MPNVSGTSASVFKKVVSAIRSSESPEGPKLSAREINLAKAALELDGTFTPADAQRMFDTLQADAKTAGGTVAFKAATATRPPQAVQPGGYGEFSGRLKRQGDLTVLELEHPISLKGKTFKQLNLGFEPATGNATYFGRIDEHSVFDPKSGPALSGISRISAGQPKYDGKKFTDANGTKLAELSYNRPMIMDAPAIILVLSADGQTAHQGAYGGFIPREANPFHGFNATRTIAAPKAAELAAVAVTGNGGLISKQTQQPLDVLGKDAQGRTWYMNEDGTTAYRAASIGKPDAVIRLD